MTAQKAWHQSGRNVCWRTPNAGFKLMSPPAVYASLSAVCEKMDAFYSPDARAQLVASTISILTSPAAMAIAWVLLGYWLALLPKIMEVRRGGNWFVTPLYVPKVAITCGTHLAPVEPCPSIHR